MIPFGREFFKLSGSGNDFVFIDARELPPEPLLEPRVVAAICSRATGVGADGIVFLDWSELADFRIRYLNRDGSLAALCGNAALCGARLAVELGIVRPGSFTIETDAGVIAASIAAGLPELELTPIARAEPEVPQITAGRGERRIGFALVGVPHLVVLCDDTESVDVLGRGSALRSHPSLPDGANVNFVASDGAEWRMRTFERGVEAETLACGTGAAAAALVLAAWGETRGQVRVRTRSGSILEVRLPALGPNGHARSPLRLRGPARIVFRGHLGELPRD